MQYIDCAKRLEQYEERKQLKSEPTRKVFNSNLIKESELEITKLEKESTNVKAELNVVIMIVTKHLDPTDYETKRTSPSDSQPVYPINTSVSTTECHLQNVNVNGLVC